MKLKLIAYTTLVLMSLNTFSQEISVGEALTYLNINLTYTHGIATNAVQNNQAVVSLGEVTVDDIFLRDDVGTNTVSMVPSIYVNQITASTTVVVNADQTIYKTTVVNAGTMLSNDVSQLDIVNREANWRWKINITTTNGLTPVFAGIFDWDGFSPDFTVTGEYVFACSYSEDTGGKIKIKQVYPTVYQWNDSIFASTVGASYFEGSTKYIIPISTSISNRQINVSIEDNDYTILTFGQIGPLPTGSYISAGIGYTLSAPAASVMQTNYNEGATTKNVYIALRPGIPGPYLGNPFVYLYFVCPTFAAGNRQAYTPKSRKMNELEIKAYNAGWRP